MVSFEDELTLLPWEKFLAFSEEYAEFLKKMGSRLYINMRAAVIIPDRFFQQYFWTPRLVPTQVWAERNNDVGKVLGRLWYRS